MAEKTEQAQKTPTDFFNVALAATIDGIKRLDAVGVDKNKAAELVGRLWTDACNEACAANYSQNPPTAGGPPTGGQGGGQGEQPATDKAGVIAAFKRDVTRLGITSDDMDRHFGSFERTGRSVGGEDEEEGEGDDSGDTEVPVVAQQHGPKKETAAGRRDDTNPGASPAEPTTGAPPKVEPGTGPKTDPTGKDIGGKPPKPAKPTA